MSVEIWPPISPEQLKVAKATAQKRELDWLLEELHGILKDLKHGLEDCYALLAPVDPGSTLVLTTPRNEIVKGTVTRVGTRIVKGTIHLRLRTLPAQTLTINPNHPIHLAPLMSLHSLLTESLNVLGLTLSYCYSDGPTTPSSTTPPSPGSPAGPPISSPHFLAAQLRLLSQHLSEASSHLKGPPLAADPTWTTNSVAPSHFQPPQPPGIRAPGSPPSLSFHLNVQDGCLVLWLRSLEPVDAPVNLGTKLALAIGTTRRIDHDESERVFCYCCDNPDAGGPEEGAAAATAGGGGLSRPGTRMGPGSVRSGSASGGMLSRPGTGMGPRSVRSSSNGGGGLSRPGTGMGPGSVRSALAPAGRNEVDVYVREKVRVESADPSLLSLTAKLTVLGLMLDLARRNLAAVMGEDLED